MVLDVRSGEVLALANLPDYDPNARAGLSDAQLRNRVLTDSYEPGSVKSSNVGTVKLALQMPARDLWSLLTEVGFGQAPQLGFPGTAAGRLRPHAGWKPIEHATISFGHGISTSLLQMAQSYLVFARDGDMIPVISPATSAAVRAMMERATWPGGTAPRARVPGYRVAGKTSTAHKPVDGRYTDCYISGFVGLAPVSAPRIIVAVMVDEPTEGGYYGGRVAAPVFSAVAQDTLRALGVAPDAEVAEILPADAGGEEA